MFALTLPTSVRDANATHVSAHPYGIGLRRHCLYGWAVVGKRRALSGVSSI